MTLEARLVETLQNDALHARLRDYGAPLFECAHAEGTARALCDANAEGLALALLSHRDTGYFLSHRPELLEQIATGDASTLAEHRRDFADLSDRVPIDDLETALDAVRILRREETHLVGCLELGGIAAFDEVSEFLSLLAEAITERCLQLATAQVRRKAELSILGMGKIAGREFTYQSDLDLIFLYRGGAGEIESASRIGQRLISYLTTLTGAGIAYPVDTRLRPSGKQGMLVTSLEHFERYQNETAQVWEHVALLRSRAIAGNCAAAQEILERVRGELLREPGAPWDEIAAMRQRVVDERSSGASDEIPIKTGVGGLMDVDFLAGGAMLERGGAHAVSLSTLR